MNFYDLLEKDFIILDGAMGTQLQKRGLAVGAPSDFFNMTNPDTVTGVHRSYIQSGADIIYANTFGSNRCKLAGSGYSVTEAVTAGISAARKAAQGTDILVALDIGPTGEMPVPFGTLEFEDFVEIFAEQVKAGAAVGTDLVVIETMFNLNEARAAVLAVKENSVLPVLCTMTFDENGRTFTGCDAKAMAITLEGLGVDALGVNCSLGPDKLKDVVKSISEYCALPLVVKANAGLPDTDTGKYAMTPGHFASGLLALAPYGLRFAGGCCGTDPEIISVLKTALSGLNALKTRAAVPPFVCNASKVVPTGNSLKINRAIHAAENENLRAALAHGDFDYVTELALDQMDDDADILCINVGAPGIDESAAMKACISELQGTSYPPLMLESKDPHVLEAGLRAYAGCALISSECPVHLIKKYGAKIISS